MQMSKEDFSTYVTDMKSKIGDVESAKISEDALNIMSTYNNALDRINELEKENQSLNADKEELLKTNGRLFQQIGFDKPKEEMTLPEHEVKKININEIIDEKGNVR